MKPLVRQVTSKERGAPRPPRCRMWMMLALVYLAGCSSGGGEVTNVSSKPLLKLSSKYELAVTTIGDDCALGAFALTTTPAVVQLRQTNNDVVWTVFQTSADGEKTGPSMTLAGRLCKGEDDGVVLRLRGSRVSRVQSGETACRSALWLPAAAAECRPTDDLCSDPAAFELKLNQCSGQLVGAFRSCFTFQESCFGQPPCRMGLLWIATPLTVLDYSPESECDPMPMPSPGVGCADECTRCGCGD